jgi:hypothetical protein
MLDSNVAGCVHMKLDIFLWGRKIKYNKVLKIMFGPYRGIRSWETEVLHGEELCVLHRINDIVLSE